MEPGCAAIVVAGGPAPPPAVAALLPATAYVVAADSGVDHAHALGLRIDVAIGDFDSVSAAGLAALERSGTPCERHPAAKDATDFELAVALALRHRPDHLLVVGSAGGRLDHLLGMLAVLAGPGTVALQVEALLDRSRVSVVRSRAALRGRVGELVSLIPLHGRVTGVTTAGLRWPLVDADLDVGSSLGVSNEFAAGSAGVQVTRGTLLVVQPDALTDPSTEDS